MNLKIEGKLVKQGNSFYVIVPKALVNALGKEKGDKIVLEVKK